MGSIHLSLRLSERGGDGAVELEGVHEEGRHGRMTRRSPASGCPGTRPVSIVLGYSKAKCWGWELDSIYSNPSWT